jgi:hypothetical protein
MLGESQMLTPPLRRLLALLSGSGCCEHVTRLLTLTMLQRIEAGGSIKRHAGHSTFRCCTLS